MNIEYAGNTYQARWAICHRCDGHGVHDCFEGGMTQSEYADACGDPDFREDYGRGSYDTRCTECGGGGKIKEIDWDRCTAAQQKEIEAERQAEHDDWQDREGERRMGA